MALRPVVRFATLWILGLSAAVFLRPASGAPPLKLRVKIDGSAIYAAPSQSSQKFGTVELGRILDSEGLRGDFYQVTLELKGAKITGFITKIAVVELSESEAERLSKESPGPGEAGTNQLQLVARIEARIEQCRDIIRSQKDLAQGVEKLRPIIAEVFGLEDRQKQRQFACNLYYLLGVGLAKSGDNPGALREFQNMFVVDAAIAEDVTKGVTDQDISTLVETAKKMQKGVLVNYTLSVNTEPQGATVKVDGKLIGTSPTTCSTSNPKVTLEVEKKGFAPVKKDKFLMQPSETETIPLQSIGRTVRVTSAPPGAKVFLDGQDTGLATACELPYVPYGERRIRLVSQDYLDWETTVQVLEGPDPIPVSAALAARNYILLQQVGGVLNKPFKFPTAVAVDKAGYVYIADATSFKIRRYDPELRTFGWNNAAMAIRKLDTPAGIAFDHQESIYVTDSAASCVVKFDRNGRQVAQWGNQGVKTSDLNGPTGIALDANNDVYVADTGGGRVVKYSSTGAYKKAWGKPGTGKGDFSAPTGIVVNSRNEIVVVDKGGRVQKFTSEGVYISEFGKPGIEEGELNRPQGLALDAMGYYYVADTGNNRILKFSPEGKLVAGLTGPVTGPVAVAVNDQGAVYIAEKNNHRIQEFQVPPR